MAQTFAAACVAFVMGWVGFGVLLASAPSEHKVAQVSVSRIG